MPPPKKLAPLPLLELDFPLVPLPEGWPADFAAARAAQLELAPRVRIADDLGPVRVVAGVDAAYDPVLGRVFAAAVCVNWPCLDFSAAAGASTPIPLPYVSGYLSFRELPAVLAAIARLPRQPDLVFCDGQGIAHPRGFGLACHLGVAADIPAIGAAKTRLVGEYGQPGPERGDRAALSYKGEQVGYVLRTRANVHPLFVSPGHRVGPDSAALWTLRLAARYRLPEPTRMAHNAVTLGKRRARENAA